MRYLDPIRMYLFTSAIFFLLFFSFGAPKVNEEQQAAKLTNADRMELADDYQKALTQNPADSSLRRKIALLRDTSRPVAEDSVIDKAQSFSFSNKNYKSVREYDSVQAALPVNERDSWLGRQFVKQAIKIQEKYGYNNRTLHIFVDIFLHKLPYLLFLSLPFFALILKLLYHRQKQFFYSDHAVFTLYHYIFSFILLLLIFGMQALSQWLGWGIFGLLQTVLLIAWPVYLFVEMKNFYRQRKRKTLGKFLLLNMAGFIIVMILFITFLVFSIFQM